MNEDTNVCRLCLKSIEKDAPCSPIVNNDGILQNLNAICYETVKNLQVTKSPVICDTCDNKLKRFAHFKENIISNEFQIQCNQKKDLNSFLESISKDFDKICRFCLEILEDPIDLQRGWKKHNTTFIKCNIHMNADIPKPSKICNSCDTTFQDMWNFMVDCSENEKHIVDLSSRNEAVTNKDLQKISSLNDESEKNKCIEEGNNNILEKRVKREGEVSCENGLNEAEFSRDAKNIIRVCDLKGAKTYSNRKKITVNAENMGSKETASKNKVDPLMIKSVSNDNLYVNDSEKAPVSSEEIANHDPSMELPLTINKTPNTYKRTKHKKIQNKPAATSTSKFNTISTVSLNPPISTPSTSKAVDNIIDASPLTNIADITVDLELALAMNDTIEVERDSNNVTQELIDLLAGTEEDVLIRDAGESSNNSSNHYKNAAELLSVLEDSMDGSEAMIYGLKVGEEKCEKIKLLQNGNSTEKVIEKASEVKTIINQEKRELSEAKKESDSKKIQSIINLKSPISVVKKTTSVNKGRNATKSKKVTKISKKNDESGVKHNLRQKTIAVSFREMLNMKPAKNKASENVESPTKDASEINRSPETVNATELPSASQKNDVQSQLRTKRVVKKAVEGGGKRKTEKNTEPRLEIKKSVEETQIQEKDTEKKKIGKKVSQIAKGKVSSSNQQKSTENSESTVNTNGEKAVEKSQDKGVVEIIKVIKRAPKPTSDETTTSKQQEIVEYQTIKATVVKNSTRQLQNIATTSQKQVADIKDKQPIIKTNSEGNKGVKVPQVEEKDIVKKKIVKRKQKNTGDEATTSNPQETTENPTTTVTMEENVSKESHNIASTSQIKESVQGRKRPKKEALDSQKDSIPKKRVRKPPVKKLIGNDKEINANHEQISEKTCAGRKKVVKETKGITESTKTGTAESTDANEQTDINQAAGTDADAEHTDDSEPSGQSPDKPVVVRIIRRKKTKNKAQRDKTWLELTGKTDDEGTSKPDNVPKKRRGRPPLPDSQKIPKKPKRLYYQCDSCPFKSLSHNIITQHQYIHMVVDDVIQYKCNQCGFRATSEELLIQHKATHLTLGLIYKCMFCEFSHKRKSSTMYHTLRHDDKDIANMFYCLVLNEMTEEEYYECFQCEYQNVEESSMPDHVIDHQIEEIKNPILAKFSCKECFYKTKFEDLFKRHMEMHALKKKCGKAKKEPKKEAGDESQTEGEEEVATVYSCDLCCYLTYNKRSLSNHKGLKHTRYEQIKSDPERPNKKAPPPSDEVYRCNECSYTTTKKPHLSRHVLVHRSKENMEYYECPHCIFETKHRRSYTRHMEIRHKVIV